MCSFGCAGSKTSAHPPLSLSLPSPLAPPLLAPPLHSSCAVRRKTQGAGRRARLTAAVEISIGIAAVRAHMQAFQTGSPSSPTPLQQEDPSSPKPLHWLSAVLGDSFRFEEKMGGSLASRGFRCNEGAEGERGSAQSTAPPTNWLGLTTHHPSALAPEVETR